MLAIWATGASLALVLPIAAAEPSGDGRAIAAKQIHFVDGEDPRRLGEVRAEVTYDAAAAGYRLIVSLAPLGPMVEPSEGYTGRAGASMTTALRLKQMVFGELPLAPAIVTAGEVRPGLVSASGWEQLPVRRIHLDGRIDHQGTSAERYPTLVTVGSPLLDAGVHELWLVVADQPRLWVQVEARDGYAEILSLEALTVHGDGATAATAVVPAAVAAMAPILAQPEADDGYSPPTDAASWSQRDAEGQWMLFQRHVDSNPGAGKAWVRFAREQGDDAFLEMLCLYTPEAMEEWGAGRALAEMNSPRWPRVAAWLTPAAESNKPSPPEKLMEAIHPEQTLAWLEAHPHPDNARLTALAKRLREAGTVPDAAATERLLGPLSDREVLGHLEAEGAVEFGEQLRAEPGTVYVHQVVREIGTAARTRRADATVFAKLEEHPHWRIRQAVFLAYADGPARATPADRCHAAMQDEAEDPRVREAALLAWTSAQDAFTVMFELLLIAHRPDGPLWEAAVSVLGDVGDGFALAKLEEATALDPAQRSFMDVELARMRQRHEKVQEDMRRRPIVAAWRLAHTLQRRDEHPRSEEYLAWMIGDIRQTLSPAQVRSLVDTLRRGEPEQLDASIRAEIVTLLTEQP